ncbi:hypothetical protein WG954_09120 [Lacibacter sp. H375]|uniref:hypothetical protein n=1 Tax=Lacibacter sp. H375 TaxID=3133424 RepID=UPI0030BA63D2
MRKIILLLLGIYFYYPANARFSVNPSTSFLIVSLSIPNDVAEQHLSKQKKLSAKKKILFSFLERKLVKSLFKKIDEKKVRKNGYVAMIAGFVAILMAVLIFTVTTWETLGLLLVLLLVSLIVGIISSTQFFARRKKIENKNSVHKRTGVIAVISLLVAAIIAALSISYQMGGL